MLTVLGGLAEFERRANHRPQVKAELVRKARGVKFAHSWDASFLGAHGWACVISPLDV
jgi:hypothetical protein